jgi:hypothetical protein
MTPRNACDAAAGRAAWGRLSHSHEDASRAVPRAHHRELSIQPIPENSRRERQLLSFAAALKDIPAPRGRRRKSRNMSPAEITNEETDATERLFFQ